MNVGETASLMNREAAMWNYLLHDVFPSPPSVDLWVPVCLEAVEAVLDDEGEREITLPATTANRHTGGSTMEAWRICETFGLDRTLDFWAQYREEATPEEVRNA